MDWSNRSKEVWHERAQEWDQMSDEMWQEGTIRANMLDFLTRQIGPAPLRLLDLGCGPGASTRVLKERGYEAIGVDQAPGMVEAAGKRGVEAYVSNADPLPFPDESFNAVFACTSLEWTDRPDKILAEVRRVLKPGGRFVPVTLGAFARPRQSGYPRLLGEAVAHNMMMPWELHQLLTEGGFECVDMQGEYSDPSVLPAVEALGENWRGKAALAFLWGFSTSKTNQ